jgi:hypothetical protein
VISAAYFLHQHLDDDNNNKENHSTFLTTTSILICCILNICNSWSWSTLLPRLPSKNESKQPMLLIAKLKHSQIKSRKANTSSCSLARASLHLLVRPSILLLIQEFIELNVVQAFPIFEAQKAPGHFELKEDNVQERPSAHCKQSRHQRIWHLWSYRIEDC